jgi:hypothetical protein
MCDGTSDTSTTTGPLMGRARNQTSFSSGTEPVSSRVPPRCHLKTSYTRSGSSRDVSPTNEHGLTLTRYCFQGKTETQRPPSSNACRPGVLEGRDTKVLPLYRPRRDEPQNYIQTSSSNSIHHARHSTCSDTYVSQETNGNNFSVNLHDQCSSPCGIIRLPIYQLQYLVDLNTRFY